MTPKQRKSLYFPAWQKAFAANWRKDADGSWVAIDPQPGGEYARRVGTLTTQRCARECVVAKPDDYRHAAQVIALGVAKSSNLLTNPELDKLLHFFELMVDAENITAAVAVEDPTEDSRRRLIWAVENCGMPVPYIAAVARATQGSAEWRGLSNHQLGLLVATLRSRAAVRNSTPQLPPRTAPTIQRVCQGPDRVKIRMLDDDGNRVCAGDTVRFSYGIPPVRVVAKLVQRGNQLVVLTPGHIPAESNLRSLRKHVGAWFKQNSPQLALPVTTR